MIGVSIRRRIPSLLRQFQSRLVPNRPPQRKKPRAMPGALILSLVARSVLRDDWAAELVVQANGDQVDILLDVVGAGGHAGNREDAGEGGVMVAHEQMVVFDRGRPVRSEAVFEADANRATPTGVGRTIEDGAGTSDQTFVLVVGDRSTALDVEQGVVPGVADLAGEQAEGIDLGAVGGTNVEGRDAGVGAAEVRPVALRFNAEHERAALPAIADLTTDRAAGR